MKALKAFIKPFEEPQRNVKIKIKVYFLLIPLSEMHGAEGVKTMVKDQWYIQQLFRSLTYFNFWVRPHSITSRMLNS